MESLFYFVSRYSLLYVNERILRKRKSFSQYLDFFIRLFTKFLWTWTVAAHLRGMRPTPSSDKDILKPNGKLKTLNTTD